MIRARGRGVAMLGRAEARSDRIGQHDLVDEVVADGVVVRPDAPGLQAARLLNRAAVVVRRRDAVVLRPVAVAPTPPEGAVE